jgi:hypothetical protein
MGRLTYSGIENSFEIEERTLAHLRLVIMNKLRRDESFMMHLPHGDGVRSLWVDASLPLMLTFHGSRSATINPAWIDELMASASSAYGLQLVREPDNVVVRDPAVRA